MGDGNNLLKRDTARALIVHNGRLLLIERTRPGKHYFSTPGGGIEAGETPEQAVAREVLEETSLNVQIEREVYIWDEGSHRHHFFVATYISGEPELHKDAEEASNGPDNIHNPRWMRLDEIERLPFGYWEPIKKRILEDLGNGFPEKVVHLTA